ncbi:hypothetical protein [Gordonia sp. C13]|uniref:hypothetical protein n=1 Tax=Gordonia sp. C13 TaxID=2935078 RepID=UPI00200B6F63|nr:hypothetical protein [Gordonia sp. C13]MCK8616091.1 hypothetical protein [Gordonia sp. C13]
MSRARLFRSALLAGAVALSVPLAGCSSDDAEPASPTTASGQTSAGLTSPAPTAEEIAPSIADSSAARPSTDAPRSTTGSADAGDAKTLSCRDYRALEDEGRAAAVAALGVKSNADQVATVAATVCLTRLDDKVADVIDELVPTR